MKRQAALAQIPVTFNDRREALILQAEEAIHAGDWETLRETAESLERHDRVIQAQDWELLRCEELG